MRQDESSWGGTVSARMRNSAIFTEEYNSWIRAGHKHQSAERRAMDYFRKHTQFEVTHDWVSAVDNQTHYEDHAEFRSHLNSMLRNLKKEATATQMRVVWYRLVMEDLDEFMDDDLREECYQIVGNHRPETQKELAECLGLAVNKIGVCTTLRATQKRIRAKCVELGMGPDLCV